ncbi:hypothetical protein I4U23_011090 [Adineta vaga]|nr:hypothetical protein I4U23_011090 [Adineta vaga]
MREHHTGKRNSRVSLKQANPTLHKSNGTKQKIKYIRNSQNITISSLKSNNNQITADDQQMPKQDEEVILYSEILTSTDNHNIRPSKVSSSDSSIDSINSTNRFSNASKIFLVPSVINKSQELRQIPQRWNHYPKRFNIVGKDWKEQEKQRKHRRRRRCCGLYPICCSPCCCCIFSILALVLLLSALTALLIALLTNKGNHTVTTTSTLTTSTTTTDTTATTSTSSTSSTSSSTTSSTSTSTTSSTSTSSTSSTGTSTTSTTSTSETTSTSVTSTTSTATTTTTSSTTPTPPCLPVNKGSSSNLHSATTGPTIYTCHAFQWTAPNTGPVTLAFAMRNDPSSWYIDDVSVYHGGTQMLLNGDLESGTLAPGWIRTQANNYNCGLFQGHVSSNMPRTGTYSIRDGSMGCGDVVSQTFSAIANSLYIVSYWFKTNALGSPYQTIAVTLS